jgi:hypothetical protein
MKALASEIRIDGDAAFIFIKEGMEAAIDAADIPLVQGKRWRVAISKAGHPYVCTGQSPNGTFVMLHRLLLTPPRDRFVDHVDGNTLNNRRSNLRLATGRQNNANRVAARNNRLGVKGVVRECQRYKAEIWSNGQRHRLGSFATAEEASAAYFGAAKILFGEFAKR